MSLSTVFSFKKHSTENKVSFIIKNALSGDKQVTGLLLEQKRDRESEYQVRYYVISKDILF